MSHSCIDLCSSILNEHYGPIIEKVGIVLLKKDGMSLGSIITMTNFDKVMVKKSLTSLIQLDMVTYKLHKRGFVEYFMDKSAILLRLRFPCYIYTAKCLFQEAGELLIEEMLLYGKIELNHVIHKVNERLKVSEPAVTHDAQSVHAAFSKMANCQFVRKCGIVEHTLETSRGAIPIFAIAASANSFDVPEYDYTFDSYKKRKRIGDSSDDDAPPGKRSKLDKFLVNHSEEGVYWEVNFCKFDLYLRDQLLIEAVTTRIDHNAGEILRTMLRVNELTSLPDKKVSDVIMTSELHQAIPKELNMTKSTIEKYLSLLSDDSINFISKIGDRGGGEYVIDFQQASRCICIAHSESIIQERCGSKSLRIFRLILAKKHLEQKQIEEFAMIPSKEAKEMLYHMVALNYLTITEVPRTPDFAPARTFYLFAVNLLQLGQMFIEELYKSILNARLRKVQEISENKRLLDKEQRIDAILATLETNDPSQKEEIEEMISVSERGQIKRVKNYIDRLDICQLQLDETLFVFNMFVFYSTMK